jgi:hypothetical protein
MEMNLDIKKEISRKKFFASVGLGLVMGYLLSPLPIKFIQSLKRNSNRKSFRVTIHPSAVKRTTKV